MINRAKLRELSARLEGELRLDEAMRVLYSTDASEYQEMPLAVALPKSEADVRLLIAFASENRVGIIPRAAGTSLAGQVVGKGIVVDLGRYMNRILHYDAARGRVAVQPGVVRNDLNLFLKPNRVFFAPETSTANRAMIAGMVGNNSCGANSIVYGSTSDHLVSCRGYLSDGSEATFGPMTPEEFEAKCAARDCLETRIYKTVGDLLGNRENRRLITDNFPKPKVTRRNTGYGLDRLMDCSLYRTGSSKPFNLCRLIAGSAGTLFLGVEFVLNCEPLPPPGALLCVHFGSVADALRATVIAMEGRPHGCELIDRFVLEATKENPELSKNRFFVQGDPEAVLVIEIRRMERTSIEGEMRALEEKLRAAGLGYAFPVVWGDDCNRVWDLRRAGQSLMNNVPGDAKPHVVVEDTAVAVEDLPSYIAEFDNIIRGKYGIDCIYYAHAGAGELHNRPLFNLKTSAGLKMFRGIGTDIAALVKKYRGSLSGEHGDGRLRGEFIESAVGPECYAMMRRLKNVFDPLNIFNPEKVIDPAPMDRDLRCQVDKPEPQYRTFFDFTATEGVLRASEKCSGAGECRKSHLMGGTMCPSYMATRQEEDSTRGRANMLRQALTNPRNLTNPWDSEEIKGVMDLCLSCKACRSECPSNVDMARLKAEWQQHYYDAHGVPLRARLIGGFATSMRFAALAPAIYNWATKNAIISSRVKRIAGVASARSLPPLHGSTLKRWHARRKIPPRGAHHGRVYFFADEFTDYSDTPVGIMGIELLTRLGYEVIIPKHVSSGRAHFSKGLVRQGQKLAVRNVELLKDLVSERTPIIGLEPSALLGFRDEYPDLMPADLKPAARALAKHALLIDEFIVREAAAGRIRATAFDQVPRKIKLHGHCHQKALSSLSFTTRMLQLPVNHQVEVIPSGCCGMAGSFGYEEDHFEISRQIGELILFPSVRSTPPETLLAAPGTSCRHQIKDCTGRVALHPVEILHRALVNS